MSSTVIVVLIYHRHIPIGRINLLGSKLKSNVFPVKYELLSRVLNKRQDDV
jgi:hypothetical protein